MAETFRFVDNDGTELVDFLGGDFYYQPGYGFRSARPGEMVVNESIPLLKVDTITNILPDIKKIDDALRLASEYHNNPLLDNWVWFEQIASGESDKRALVYPGGYTEFRGERKNAQTPFMRHQTAAPVLYFPRHRYFESKTAYTLQQTTNVNFIGGTVPFTGGGTAESRISMLRLTAISGLSTAIQRLWIGIREEGEGTADFEPKMQLYNGVAKTETVKETGVTSAYNNQCMKTTPTALNDDQLRVTMTLSQATTGNETHYIGRYLVLLRWAATSSAEFAIKLGQAFTAIGNTRYLPPKYVTGAGDTTWDMLPLGVMDIPMSGHKLGWGNAEVDATMLKLNVEMLSGTTSSDIIRLDTLTLIPANRILTTSAANFTGQLDEGRLTIHCLPNDEFVAYTSAFTSPSGPDEPIDIIDLEPNNFYLPVSDGVMVIAGARESTSDKADQIETINLEAHYRWRSYRS